MQPLPLLRSSLALLLAIVALHGGDSGVVERIDQVMTAFERGLDQDFQPVKGRLRSWLEGRQRSAEKELMDLLGVAKGDDAVYIAYHLLSANPRNKSARDVFAKAGTPAPFDERGQAASGWKMPVCRNQAIIDKVQTLSYPPFDIVAEVVDLKSPLLKSFWARQGRSIAQLKTDLVGFANQGHADTVYPMLAYYYDLPPKEVVAYYTAKQKRVPRNRVWFSPVDRWLLDHELAGIDCLRTPPMGQAKAGPMVGRWKFLEMLRNCRVESVLQVAGGPATFSVLDERNQGAQLQVQRDRVVLREIGGAGKQLAEAQTEVALDKEPVAVQLEVRGARAFVRVAGVQLIDAELSAERAYEIVESAGSFNAKLLRLRYLADLPPSLKDAVVAGVKPPADPPWLAERKTQLEAKSVSFEFSDTPVEEVAALLSAQTGVAISLDTTAEPLRNLPVSLSAKSMKLKTALEWIQRITDLSYVPTEKGLALAWKKK